MADLDDLRDAAGRRPDVRAPFVARRLFRLVDGGAFPASAGRVFLGVAADVDCAESEGASASAVAADADPEPVLVLGGRPPAVGDLVAAVGVGGRWVAEVGRPGNIVYCGGCAIPKADLTLTWTNILLGTHSAPMTFDGTDSWATACVNQILFRLACRGGATTFTATYFVAGSCPAGTPVTCTGPGSSPFGLGLTAQSCDPLLLQYSATSCPALAAQGYTRFTVTR